MKKGDLINNEYRQLKDEKTGATVHQLTSDPSTNHSLFFLNPSFRPGTSGERQEVGFVTYRDGPQLCLFDFATRRALVLTNPDGLQAFSPAYSPDGRFLYYTTEGGQMRRVDVDSAAEETLIDKPPGKIGECSLSGDGRYVVTSCKMDATYGLLVLDVEAQKSEMIFETDLQIIHPQFHPTDANLIEYAGNPNPRLWMIHRDGTQNECLYRNAWNEFIVHESFLGTSNDLIFTIWPYRLARLNIHDRRPETIVETNAWHMASNRDGTLIVSDTNHPDRGLLLINPETGTCRTLCYPGASCHGSQWKFDHPATPDAWKALPPDADADARVLSWMEMKVDTVYGPQWTHPHPAFDDGGRRVVYTSDVTGDAQVYVVDVPDELLP